MVSMVSSMVSRNREDTEKVFKDKQGFTALSKESVDNKMTQEDKTKIEEFLKWLDQEGFNLRIISAIRKMLLGGENG
jgi:hypothetical protein